MCTVVFIPGGSKCFFASLRDESPLRPAALAPRVYKANNACILAPKDALAGGTWLGVTSAGSVIILLNGGFEKHERHANYRKSRGIIVAELLATSEPVSGWDRMDMAGVEPYTLVIWNGGNLYQLVWDGEKKYNQPLPSDQSYLWSSATLYDEPARTFRSQLFEHWMGTARLVNARSLLDFFRSFTANEHGFLMNRNEQVKTLSYTFIELETGRSAAMHYHELTSGCCQDKQLVLKNSNNGVAVVNDFARMT